MVGLHDLFGIIALVTAPVLLFAHIWWKPPRYWFVYFQLSICAVWFGGSASTYLYHADLGRQIKEYEARGEDVPHAIMTDWASDASVAIMPMFGWIPGIIHSSVCALGFVIVRCVVRLILPPESVDVREIPQPDR